MVWMTVRNAAGLQCFLFALHVFFNSERIGFWLQTLRMCCSLFKDWYAMYLKDVLGDDRSQGSKRVKSVRNHSAGSEKPLGGETTGSCETKAAGSGHLFLDNSVVSEGNGNGSYLGLVKHSTF